MKTEFDIKQKLETSILPYVILAGRLKKSRQYYLYHSYNYSKEVLTLLAGYGISSPVFNSVYTTAGYNPVSTSLGVVGIVAGVLVGIFRMVAGGENVAKSVIDQKKIAREFRAFSNNVEQALQKETPDAVLNEIISIQQRISALVNTSIQEGVWPYDGISNDIRNKAKEKTGSLMSTFQSTWVVPPEEEAESIPDQR